MFVLDSFVVDNRFLDIFIHGVESRNAAPNPEKWKVPLARWIFRRRSSKSANDIYVYIYANDD